MHQSLGVTEALIWTLALAINPRTKAEYIEAKGPAHHYDSFHFRTEVEEANKQAVLLAEQWDHEPPAPAIPPPGRGLGLPQLDCGMKWGGWQKRSP